MLYHFSPHNKTTTNSFAIFLQCFCLWNDLWYYVLLLQKWKFSNQLNQWLRWGSWCKCTLRQWKYIIISETLSRQFSGKPSTIFCRPLEVPENRHVLGEWEVSRVFAIILGVICLFHCIHMFADGIQTKTGKSTPNNSHGKNIITVHLQLKNMNLLRFSWMKQFLEI